jgi:hypothetical protein
MSSVVNITLVDGYQSKGAKEISFNGYNLARVFTIILWKQKALRIQRNDIIK